MVVYLHEWSFDLAVIQLVSYICNFTLLTIFL